MTTMEPQLRDFELPQFVFLSNKPKKNYNGSYDSYPNFVQKSRGTAAHNNSNRPFSQFPNFHPNQQRNNGQGHYSAKKNHYNNFNGDYEFNAKGNGFGTKSPMEKKSWQAYASTADSDNSHSPSELNGFKIVHDGHVIHDETEEDFDSPNNFNLCSGTKTVYDKYASSVMVIGPNAKEISLPSFA